MLDKLKILLIIVMLTPVAFAQNVITVTDADISPGESYTMTSNNTYLLDGFVFVEDGSVLNIEAGTIVKGKAEPTTGNNASALIIAQGGQIFAEGPAELTIIFTAQVDDINDPNDLTHSDR
ncbi:MAG: hypothetical protein R6W90_08420, partial [Ignavibacteriaceae bacterium]